MKNSLTAVQLEFFPFIPLPAGILPQSVVMIRISLLSWLVKIRSIAASNLLFCRR